MKRLEARLILVSAIISLFILVPETSGFGKNELRIPDEATAKSLDGKTVSLADHKGKLIFFILWKIDCVACRTEIPILNRLQKEYSGQNFTIIGLSLDRGIDPLVADVVKQSKITYPVWLGYGQPMTKYAEMYSNSPFIPMLLAIAPDGEVFGSLVGAFPTYDDAVFALKQAQSFVEEKKRAK